MQLKENVTPDDHSQGPDDAKATLVEYGDYQCSHCGLAYPVVKRLQERFGQSLRFTFRNFPLAEAHPMAESAAEAAEYAATKGKFWQMHDDLYEHQTELSIELLATLATKNGLDTKSLTEALVQQTFQKRVRKDFIGGARSSVNGTPTFFINGIRHDGEADVETLAAAIEKFL
jgi:protein-disulfide isomerase